MMFKIKERALIVKREREIVQLLDRLYNSACRAAGQRLSLTVCDSSNDPLSKKYLNESYFHAGKARAYDDMINHIRVIMK